MIYPVHTYPVLHIKNVQLVHSLVPLPPAEQHHSMWVYLGEGEGCTGGRPRACRLRGDPDTWGGGSERQGGEGGGGGGGGGGREGKGRSRGMGGMEERREGREGEGDRKEEKA